MLYEQFRLLPLDKQYSLITTDREMFDKFVIEFIKKSCTNGVDDVVKVSSKNYNLIILLCSDLLKLLVIRAYVRGKAVLYMYNESKKDFFKNPYKYLKDCDLRDIAKLIITEKYLLIEL